MRSSNERVASVPWLSWSVPRLLKGWIDGPGSAAPSWETPTLASAFEAHPGEPCVLVADDSPFNRMLASEMLAACGVTSLLAADGAQAVVLARDVRLDLVLMDLQMPVLDGRAATRQIRRDERTLRRARVPVLAFTAKPIAPAALSDDGFDGLLDKPCHSLALRACLQRWCAAAAPFGAKVRSRTDRKTPGL